MTAIEEHQAANDKPPIEVDKLRSELEILTKGGIIEVAVRNPSVAEYMSHWEGRTAAAEAQVASLKAALETAQAKIADLRVIANVNGDWTIKYSDAVSRATEAEALLEKARAAIRPFAKLADNFVIKGVGNDLNLESENGCIMAKEVWFRRARAALTPSEEEL